MFSRLSVLRVIPNLSQNSILVQCPAQSSPIPSDFFRNAVLTLDGSFGQFGLRGSDFRRLHDRL